MNAFFKLRKFFAPVLLSLLSTTYIVHAQVVNPSQPATGVPLAGTGIAVAGQTVSINYGVANSPFTGNLSVGGTLTAGTFAPTNINVSGTATVGTVNATAVAASGVSIVGNESVSGTTTNTGPSILTGAVSGAGIDTYIANHGIVQTVANVTALRAVSCVAGLLYADQGYTTLGDGGASLYVCNGADTTSTDNGGTILASASTFRLYLVTASTNAYVSALQWGAKCDGTTVDTTRIQAAFTAGGNLLLPANKTCVSGPLTVTANLNISGFGATMLQAPGTAVTGNAFTGLWNIQTNVTLIVNGGTYDGNSANQTDTFGQVDFLWDAAGSMQLFNVTVQNTHGHAIRTGNIDNFSSSVFAHDVILDHITVNQCQTTSGCGDAVRIERTNRARVSYSNIVGGMSSVRTQLYDSDLTISNNESSFAWGDDGITIAMSTNLVVSSNSIHDNFSQGIEVDACVNAQITNNLIFRNGHSGIFATEYGAAKYTNSATFWGTIATGYGTNYATQTFTSPLVSNLNVVFANNQEINNTNADRLIGQDTGVAFTNNYLNNPALSGYTSQLSIEGGTLNLSGVGVYENTFVESSTDVSAIAMVNYQFTTNLYGNTKIGSLPMSTFAARGNADANAGNAFLWDYTKRTSILIPVLDGTSPTGTAVTHTSTGSQNYVFSGIFGGGPQDKQVRLRARVASGSQAVTLTVSLYNGASTFVTTMLTQSVTFTNVYQEFVFRVPATASAGDNIQVQVNVPVTGVQSFYSELHLYTVN